MFTGLAKLPPAFDNCAVNVFPAGKVPVIVKGTDTVDPAQKLRGFIVPVVIRLGVQRYILPSVCLPGVALTLENA